LLSIENKCPGPRKNHQSRQNLNVNKHSGGFGIGYSYGIVKIENKNQVCFYFFKSSRNLL